MIRSPVLRRRSGEALPWHSWENLPALDGDYLDYRRQHRKAGTPAGAGRCPSERPANVLLRRDAGQDARRARSRPEERQAPSRVNPVGRGPRSG
jgi:hypothetical protein